MSLGNVSVNTKGHPRNMWMAGSASASAPDDVDGQVAAISTSGLFGQQAQLNPRGAVSSSNAEHSQYCWGTDHSDGQIPAVISSGLFLQQAQLNPRGAVHTALTSNTEARSACFPTNGAEAEADVGVDPKYSMEIIRLGSFASWLQSNASIKERAMAKAGLYYTGVGDTVQCFQCGKTFSGWQETDIPLKRHYEEHQDCQFARELFLKEFGSQHSQLDQNSSQSDSSNVVSIVTTANSSRHQSPPPGNDVPDTCIQQRMQRLSVNEYYAYDTVDSSRNLRHCGEDCPKDLNTELHRRHTFFGWPEGTPVSSEQLAKLGFFYLGVRDKVECAFCGGVLHQWEPGDDPKTEHRRHYPHCPFIRNCATSNVPLGSSEQDTAQQATCGEWRDFAQQDEEDSSAQQQAERHGHVESEPPPPPQGSTDRPKHPELISEEDRLSTFFRWPLYSPISPRKLAQAGFYYTYIDDQVKCHWCEGGLKDWQAGDDPWTEHARWYGEECGFVLRERGIGYVQQIKNTFPSLVQVAHHHSQQDFIQDYVVGAGNITVQVGDIDPEDEFEERVLDAMDSRVVRNVVEMGFGQQNVEIVVRRRLRARRGPFTTMTDLVEALLAMDDNPDGPDDPYNEDEDRSVEGPLPTGNQEPEVPGAEQMEEEPEDETPASMEELQRRLQRLKEERMCKICMSNDATMVFIPCGHLCCCEGCAHTMRSRGRKCPICRARILKIQKAFLA